MHNTITAPVVFQQKVKRSEFICFLFPVANAEQARELLGSHARQYANATHNCFAYVCGYSQETQYYSDAGEPHGTAGKPMLNALLRADVTNVLAIVTRYFGGVKLGVRGLMEAYGGTVRLALDEAEMQPALARSTFLIICDYSLVDQLKKMIASLQGSISAESWSEFAELAISVPEDNAPALSEFLDGLRLKSRLDYKIKEEGNA
jgi:uncharacterized YigZ family protein